MSDPLQSHHHSHSTGSLMHLNPTDNNNPFMRTYLGNNNNQQQDISLQDISMEKENQIVTDYPNVKRTSSILHNTSINNNPLGKVTIANKHNSIDSNPNRSSISSVTGLQMPKQRPALSDVTSRVENKQNIGLENVSIIPGNNKHLSNSYINIKSENNDIPQSVIDIGSDVSSVTSDNLDVLKIRDTDNNNKSNNIHASKKSNQYRHEENYSDKLTDSPTKQEIEANDINEYSNVEEDDNNNVLKEPLQPKSTDSNKKLLEESYNKYYRSIPDQMDEDTYDIAMVAELSNDIFDYLKDLEEKYRPNPNYMHYQPHLKWSYRRILLDWIIEVHNRFQLLPETLYLTVNIIDRFLSKKTIMLDKFQLIGASALFIASKYEEINCPTLKEIVYMLNGSYEREDIIEAERYLIDTLEFEIGWPGPMSFLRRISKADEYEYDIRTLAKYLIESTLMDSRFVSAQPSWLAAGSYFLSRVILGYNTWSQKHIFYSGYTQQQLIPLASIILDNCKNAPAHHNAIYEKYSHRRFGSSSQIVTRWIVSTEKKIHDRSELQQ